MTRSTAALAIVASAAVLVAYLVGVGHGRQIVWSYLGPADIACNARGVPGEPECWSIPAHD